MGRRLWRPGMLTEGVEILMDAFIAGMLITKAGSHRIKNSYERGDWCIQILKE